MSISNRLAHRTAPPPANMSGVIISMYLSISWQSKSLAKIAPRRHCHHRTQPFFSSTLQPTKKNKKAGKPLLGSSARGDPRSIVHSVPRTSKKTIWTAIAPHRMNPHPRLLIRVNAAFVCSPTRQNLFHQRLIPQRSQPPRGTVIMASLKVPMPPSLRRYRF